MWEPGEPRLSGRNSAASSTGSLDQILKEFEIVQATPPQQQQQPDQHRQRHQQQTAGFHNPFISLFRNLQGRPPRPELNVTSHPYQPAQRSTSRRRSGNFEEQHGYQSQLLLPVDPHPAASSSRLAASVDSSLAAHEKAAVNLTSASPALATPAEQASSEQPWLTDQPQQRPDTAYLGSRRALPSTVRPGAAPRPPSQEQQHAEALRRSLSLESLDSLPSSRSSSANGGPLTWGQAPRDNLFPLGVALPTLYRPPSSAQLQSADSAAANSSQAGSSADSRGGSLTQLEAASSLRRAQSAESSQKSNPGSLEDASRSAFGAALQGSPAASIEPAAGGHLSPFAAAARHPAPESTASQDSFSSPKSTPTSASDYGSQTAGIPGLTDVESAQQAALHQQNAFLATRKGMMSQGPYRAGHQRLFMGAMDKSGGQQPRSHLRKRDFESELLERLLSHGMKGPYQGLGGRAPAVTERQGIWRAIGLPRMAFITIVFLCLALFLLIFTGGRLHAQRIMRNRGTLVELAVATAPLTTGQPGKASDGLAQNLTSAGEGDGGDGKHHHTHGQHRNDSQAQPDPGPEEAKRHERRPNASATAQEAAADAAADAHRRPTAGLKLLEAQALTMSYMGSVHAARTAG